MAYESGSLLIGLGGFVLFAGITFILLELFSSSRTQKYRENLTDIYVAGRVRQLAEKDKIDLQKEAVNCKHYLRYLDSKEKNLDQVIEQDLKERANSTYENQASSNKK